MERKRSIVRMDLQEVLGHDGKTMKHGSLRVAAPKQQSSGIGLGNKFTVTALCNTLENSRGGFVKERKINFKQPFAQLHALENVKLQLTLKNDSTAAGNIIVLPSPLGKIIAGCIIYAENRTKKLTELGPADFAFPLHQKEGELVEWFRRAGPVGVPRVHIVGDASSTTYQDTKPLEDSDVHVVNLNSGPERIPVAGAPPASTDVAAALQTIFAAYPEHAVLLPGQSLPIEIEIPIDVLDVQAGGVIAGALAGDIEAEITLAANFVPFYGSAAAGTGVFTTLSGNADNNPNYVLIASDAKLQFSCAAITDKVRSQAVQALSGLRFAYRYPRYRMYADPTPYVFQNGKTTRIKLIGHKGWIYGIFFGLLNTTQLARDAARNGDVRFVNIAGAGDPKEATVSVVNSSGKRIGEKTEDDSIAYLREMLTHHNMPNRTWLTTGLNPYVGTTYSGSSMFNFNAALTDITPSMTYAEGNKAVPGLEFLSFSSDVARSQQGDLSVGALYLNPDTQPYELALKPLLTDPAQAHTVVIIYCGFDSTFITAGKASGINEQGDLDGPSIDSNKK